LRILKKIDSGYSKFLKFCVTFLSVAIAAMIVVLVVCRYVLHVNLSGAEELPTYMMIFCVWLGAGLVARDDKHLCVDVIYTVIKSEKVKTCLRLCTHILTSVIMWYYTVLAYKFVVKGFIKGQVSSGLMFPMWWAYSVLFIGSLSMALYYTLHSVTTAVSLGEGKKT